MRRNQLPPGIDMNMLQQLQGQMNAGPPALVEFKAGRMDYDGRMVRPDRRKGVIRIVQDASGMK